MKQLIDIRLLEDIPGIDARYVVEARVADTESGTHVSDSGFTLFNYDKAFSIGGENLNNLLERAGNKITEMICSND